MDINCGVISGRLKKGKEIRMIDTFLTSGGLN